MMKVYRVYNSQLKDYLKQRGMEWIIIALDVVPPHSKYWLFEQTEQFNKLHHDWQQSRS